MRQIRNASDTTCKQLLRDEECFADLCNYAFFQGRQVIKPEELVSRENDLSTLIGNVDDPTEIKYVDEVLKLLNVMTGDKRYEKIFQKKKGVRSMCDVAERLEKMGIVKGIEIGRLEGKEEGKAEGKAEGILEGKMQVYRNLLKKGFTEKEAREITEIS